MLATSERCQRLKAPVSYVEFKNIGLAYCAGFIYRVVMTTNVFDIANSQFKTKIIVYILKRNRAKKTLRRANGQPLTFSHRDHSVAPKNRFGDIN